MVVERTYRQVYELATVGIGGRSGRRRLNRLKSAEVTERSRSKDERVTGSSLASGVAKLVVCRK